MTTASASTAGPLTTTAVVAGKTLRCFLRTPQLVATTAGQTVLFLLVFRYVFGGAIPTGDLAYVDYMVPGVLTAGILFAASGAAVGVAQDRSDGFADRILSLPTSRTGLIAGRLVADTVSSLVATLVALGIAVLVGFRPHAPLPALAAALALLALCSLAFAALFGALGTLADGPQAAQGFGFVAIPLTFVSSAYVPTDTMPAWLAAVARHQPVTAMIDALRHLTQAHVVGPDRGAIVAATAWAIVITGASVLVARRRICRS